MQLSNNWNSAAIASLIDITSGKFENNNVKTIYRVKEESARLYNVSG